MTEDVRGELHRIDRALARIEAAVERNSRASDSLSRRHAALKSRMAEALGALDEVIARGGSRLMADVTLVIGGRHHNVACRDGEEAQVRRLGALLQDRWADAERAAGGINTERAMLFVALMLADDLDEAQRNPGNGDGDGGPSLPPGLADRLERIAAALEETSAAP